MPPQRQNLVIYQGDDWLVYVDVINADGTPADLTGFTPRAQLRRDVADRDVDVDVEITTILDTSTIGLSLDHDQTEALSAGYYWDVQVTSAEGSVTTLMYGQANVQQEVTR